MSEPTPPRKKAAATPATTTPATSSDVAGTDTPEAVLPEHGTDPLAPIDAAQAAAVVGVDAAEVLAWRATLEEIIVVTTDGRKLREVRP